MGACLPRPRRWRRCWTWRGGGCGCWRNFQGCGCHRALVANGLDGPDSYTQLRQLPGTADQPQRAGRVCLGAHQENLPGRGYCHQDDRLPRFEAGEVSGEPFGRGVCWSGEDKGRLGRSGGTWWAGWAAFPLWPLRARWAGGALWAWRALRTWRTRWAWRPLGAWRACNPLGSLARGQSQNPYQRKHQKDT